MIINQLNKSHELLGDVLIDFYTQFADKNRATQGIIKALQFNEALNDFHFLR